MDEVYVIGHLNPDTDTVISAMAMAQLLNFKNDVDRYIPVRTGELNTETEFILNKFELKTPEILIDASDKKLFLVDHTESSQMVEGHSRENIIGVIDHHKVDLQTSSPIEITVRPWGSTATIIYQEYLNLGIEIPNRLKPAILSAILSDTVILRSPTTTTHDRQIVEELAQELGIDYQELGMELFRAKAQITDKTPEQIIHNDFKVFEFGEKIVGVGQVETPDLTELESKLEDILSSMEQLKEENEYHSIILMLTDIIEEGSRLLIVSEEENLIANLFETSTTNNVTNFIPGMLSRKKQVIPVLSEKL